MAASKRIGNGVYETPSGHIIQRGEDWDGNLIGWHLLSPAREWMQTYVTKADALAALNEEI